MSEEQQQAQRSGCSAGKVILILVLAFLVVGLASVGTCVWCLATNPEVRKAGALLGETVRMGAAAQSAPGTDELEEAGCEDALVLDMRKVVRLTEDLAEEIGDEGDVQVPEEEWQKHIVVCQHRFRKPKLSCAEVAAVYGRAVPTAPREFGVSVQAGLGNESVCQGVYAPDGSLVSPLEAEDTP